MAVLPILLPPILFYLLYRVIYYFILKFYYKFIMEQEKHNIIYVLVKNVSCDIFLDQDTFIESLCVMYYMFLIIVYLMFISNLSGDLLYTMF